MSSAEIYLACSALRVKHVDKVIFAMIALASRSDIGVAFWQRIGVGIIILVRVSNVKSVHSSLFLEHQGFLANETSCIHLP